MRRVLSATWAAEPLVVKRSEFFAWAGPARSRDEALAAVEALRAAPAGSGIGHTCFAWTARRGAEHGASDDGEPKHTAGLPILQQLQQPRRALTDTLVVVQRRFGGVKLGAGPLARAYGAAAAAVLDEAPTAGEELRLRLECGHDQVGAVLARGGAEVQWAVLPASAGDGVVVEGALPEGPAGEAIAEALREELAWRVRSFSVSP